MALYRILGILEILDNIKHLENVSEMGVPLKMVSVCGVKDSRIGEEIGKKENTRQCLDKLSDYAFLTKSCFLCF